LKYFIADNFPAKSAGAQKHKKKICRKNTDSKLFLVVKNQRVDGLRVNALQVGIGYYSVLV
jgi:hypothetical protein